MYVHLHMCWAFLWMRMCAASGTGVALSRGSSSYKSKQSGADLGQRGHWRAKECLPLLSEHLVIEGSRRWEPTDVTLLMRLLCLQSTGGCPMDEALHYHP